MQKTYLHFILRLGSALFYYASENLVLWAKSETIGYAIRDQSREVEPVLPVGLFPSASLKRKAVISKQEENHA
jgi:hypothetical protein